MRFWKSPKRQVPDQPRILDWSEVDFEIKYVAFPSSKTLRFPMTSLMTNIDQVKYQHWTSFSFQRFVDIIESKRKARDIPKSSWAWYSGDDKNKLEVRDEDEFHVLLKRFERDYEQGKIEDTIVLSMIRGPQKPPKSAQSSVEAKPIGEVKPSAERSLPAREKRSGEAVVPTEIKPSVE